MNLDRLESLVGIENIKKLKNLNVLIVGLGGVGGYAFESLVRSGIMNFTIIDGDIIDKTNLNRQVLTNSENIGKLKVDEALKRAKSINKDINIKCLDIFLDNNNLDILEFKDYDYVVDTCDTINTKVLLIDKCLSMGIKIISSMGTAKKMDASKLVITTLDKTSYDPLAKNIRKLIPKEIQKKVIVISSNEETIKGKILGSNSYVPGIAGFLITNYIINDVCRSNDSR